MNIKICICDDSSEERAALNALVREWSRQSGTDVSVSEFPAAEAFWFEYEDLAPDILLLDIEMPGMNGVELAKRLRKVNKLIQIIFITGYSEYIAEGYEVAALHYLLKPLRKEKFFAVFDKFNKMRLRRTQEEKLLFRTEEGPLSLPASKIWYIEAMAHQCTLYTEDASHVLCSSIGEMIKQLSNKQEFVRCHRSYLVNVRHISAIVKPELVLDDGRRIPVSRSAEKAVGKLFIEFYKG